MKIPNLIAVAALALLGACSSERAPSEPAGRFAFYPATAESPAILLDTKTGCLEEVVKLTALDNPKYISWARKYLDTTLPKVDASGPQPKEIPNSAPPQRCNANGSEKL